MKTVKEILAFIKEFEATGLQSLEIEHDGVKLKLVIPEGFMVGNTAKAEKAEKLQEPICEGLIVKSPLVGTYFAAASPEAEPFIKVGKEVSKGQTLCIIEAMKTMNEIKAPISGKILKIHVENGKVVGFDQPLVSIAHDA